MEATKKNEMVLVGGLFIITFALTVIVVKRLKEKGIKFKFGK